MRPRVRRHFRRREARWDGFRDALVIGRPDPTRLNADADEFAAYEEGFDEGKLVEGRLTRLLLPHNRAAEAAIKGLEAATEVERWAVLVPPEGVAAHYSEYLQVGVMTGAEAEIRSRLDRAILRRWPEIP